MGAQHPTPPLEAPSPMDGNMRKRVCKACDRCRLKKSKCDGTNPCTRCRADNAICVFGERKKSHDKVYPKGYVEMLENQQSQLVTGLQELYKRAQSGEGWVGAPLKDASHGAPLTHDILERLGALKQDGQPTNAVFEEDLAAMQQRLIESGAGYMQNASSDDGRSETESPIFEHMPPRQPMFSDPFAVNQFPPTPPSHSPYPRAAKAASFVDKRSFTPISAGYAMETGLPSTQDWNPAGMGFDDSMDFLKQFDSPISFDAIQTQMMFQAQAPVSTINPCLSMKQWQEEKDYPSFFNHNHRL